MSALPKSRIKSSPESYRDLAKEALESVAEYKARAEQCRHEGNTPLASEYLQLAVEAIIRVDRYTILADFAEKNS